MYAFLLEHLETSVRLLIGLIRYSYVSGKSDAWIERRGVGPRSNQNTDIYLLSLPSHLSVVHGAEKEPQK